MEDPRSTIEHLRRSEALAIKLAERGIAVYKHDDVMLAFGSFRLELGSRRRRWSLSWDGREGFLDFSDPYSPASSSTGESKDSCPQTDESLAS